MTKETKAKKTLKTMWQDRRGKAMIKLGAYVLFFCFMAITILIMNVFTKPVTNTTSKNQEPSNITFLSLEEMWENLVNQDYHYKYQIIEKETGEQTRFEGDKTATSETGYRESKIGIIKYRKEADKIYQILVEQEEEIPRIYEEEDEPFLNLTQLKTKLDTIIPIDTISGTTKLMEYRENDTQIKVRMTSKQIVSIQIITNQKEYVLSFQEKNSSNVSGELE